MVDTVCKPAIYGAMRRLSKLVKSSQDLEDFGVDQPRDIYVLELVAKTEGGIALLDAAKLIANQNPDKPKEPKPSSAQLVLKRLEDLGHVEKRGVRKEARYVLTRKGKEALK